MCGNFFFVSFLRGETQNKNKNRKIPQFEHENTQLHNLLLHAFSDFLE